MKEYDKNSNVKILDVLRILFSMKNDGVSKSVNTSFKRIIEQKDIVVEYANPEYRVTIHTPIGIVKFWHMNKFYAWLSDGEFALIVNGETIKYTYKDARPSRITMLKFYFLMKKLGLHFPSKKEHEKYISSKLINNEKEQEKIQKKMDSLVQDRIRTNHRAELLHEINEVNPYLCQKVREVVKL